MRISLRDLSETDWPSALRSITGARIPSGIERKATSAIKNDTQRRIQTKIDRQRDWQRLRTNSQAAMRKALAGQQDMQETKQLLHASAEEWRALEIPEAVAEQEEPGIYIGSFSTTVVPPYGFNFGIEKGFGPVYLDTNENRADGSIFGNVVCPEDGAGSFGVGVSAVGIYLEPIIDSSIQFLATPALNFAWYTECAFADARSRGAIGLVVYRFRKDGTQDPSDKEWAYVETELWHDESWGWGAGPHEGSTATKLSTTFKASRGYWYSLYVFSWVQASADGGGTLYDSTSSSIMGGTVPSMTWRCI